MQLIEKGATRQQQEEKIEEILAALSLDEKIAMADRSFKLRFPHHRY